MSTIQDLFLQAQLAEAAYADFTNYLNDPAGALTNPSLGGNFSSSQAAAFAARYQVVSQLPNTASGFSATVFLDTTTGQYTFAARGTEFGPTDLSTDLGDIVADGLALDQIVDMYNYWQSLTHTGIYDAKILATDQQETDTLQQMYLDNPAGALAYENTLRANGYIIDYPSITVRSIQTVPSTLLSDVHLQNGTGVLPVTATVDVTGHSLGGHLAMAFSRLFPSATADVVAVNGAGFNYANSNVDTLFTQLGGVAGFDAGKISNAVGTAGPYLTSQDWLVLQQPAGRTDIFTESAGPSQTFGHAKEQMTDSLAVYSLFAELDTALNNTTTGLQTITDILKAETNEN
jgi:hypothetical protein